MLPHPTLLIAEETHGLRKFASESCCEIGLDCGFCDNAEELRKASVSHQNFLISVDLPGGPGLGVAAEIWQQNPSARILFWAERIAETCVRHALEFVPDETVFGYVTKSCTGEELKEAASQVFQEEQCFLNLEAADAVKRLQNPKIGLSQQEFEVLVDIGIGLTDKAIAFRRFLSRRGVTNRLNSVYKKLQLVQGVNEEWGHTYNLRNRAVKVALERGLLTQALIQEQEHAWDAACKTMG